MEQRRIWIRLGCGRGNEADYSDVSIEYLIDSNIVAVFKSQWANKFCEGKELSAELFGRTDDQRHYVTLHNAGEESPPEAPSDPVRSRKLDKRNDSILIDSIQQ